MRPFTRVVFDRRLRTPHTARLLDTVDQGPVIIMATESAVANKPDLAARLRSKGARLEVLRDDDAEMEESLKRLGSLDITSLSSKGVRKFIVPSGRRDSSTGFSDSWRPLTWGPDGVSWLGLSFADLQDTRVEQLGPGRPDGGVCSVD